MAERSRIFRRAAGACVLTVVLLFGALPAWPHEFWIQPSTFTPAPGELVRIHVLVGSRGEVDELVRSPEHALRFESWQLGESQPVPGIVGKAPAGAQRFERAGLAILVYQSRHSFAELTVDKFDGYLNDEGLDDIAAERLRRGESEAPGRESFARYAKSFVRVGNGPVDGFAEDMDLPIEFDIETNPFRWQFGDPLSFRLFYDGRPLADQQVRLIHLENSELRVTVRTDKDGRGVVYPPQSGPWMLASVYMRRAPQGVEGDWESFWANLSFELPGEVATER